MKKIAIILVLFLVFSCNNNSRTQGNKKQNSIVLDNKFIKNNEVHYETLVDSLFLFSMQPSYFKEYYFNTDTDIENKAYMDLVIQQCSNEIIPFLVEKIMDTTKTQISYADIVPLRIGDVALELIEISDKEFNIPNIIFNEFDNSNLVGLDELRKNRVYTIGNVYIPLFFKEPDFKYVNYENRMKIYHSIKTKYNN